VLDYAEADAVSDLRARLRDLVGSKFPASFLGAFTADPADFALTESFCRELGKEHLLALAWPVEFGGKGASVWEQTALREEMWAAHEPRGAQYMGLNWVGPVIMRYGTAEQRGRHLPPIAAGEVIWCQGFSEPDAGSDLASLNTRAVRDGDGWRIQGQKIWTSYAQMAQWCFLLARTGRADDRKSGITVFLSRMDQPGVVVRPIDSIMGPHHLNEVFFDQALVSADDVLGEVGGGWKIIEDVLAHERIGIARYARCDRLLSLAPAVIGPGWSSLPAALRQRWAVSVVHTRQVRMLAYSLIDSQRTEEVAPVEAAAYRIAVTRLDQEVAEVLAEIVDGWSIGTSDVGYEFARAVEDHWRYAQASTVASGTLEMQRRALWHGLSDQT
jgi:alkylation response protein AidB-like acyl-CoA dehydrogenase